MKKWWEDCNLIPKLITVIQVIWCSQRFAYTNIFTWLLITLVIRAYTAYNLKVVESNRRQDAA